MGEKSGEGGRGGNIWEGETGVGRSEEGLKVKGGKGGTEEGEGWN